MAWFEEEHIVGSRPQTQRSVTIHLYRTALDERKYAKHFQYSTLQGCTKLQPQKTISYRYVHQELIGSMNCHQSVKDSGIKISFQGHIFLQIDLKYVTILR